MKRRTKLHQAAVIGLLAAVIAPVWEASGIAQVQVAPQVPASQPSPVAQHVAALKGSLADSQTKLKTYEWVETTVVSVKGDEKSSTIQRCYYGADGKLQKIPVAAPPEPPARRGVIGRAIANKQGEVTDYMKQAVELVQQYLPPDPEAIQKVKDAGKVTIAILDPGKRIRLEFSDYLVPDDTLKIEMTLSDNRLAGIAVATVLSDKNAKNAKKDPVTLDVRMGTLNDGATYAAETTLELKAQDLKVVVTNSGYRKVQN